MGKALNSLFRFFFTEMNEWWRFGVIKASKPCFEKREPKHQFRMGKPSRRGDVEYV